MQNPPLVEPAALLRQLSSIEDPEGRYLAAANLERQLLQATEVTRRVRASAVEDLCRRGWSHRLLGERFGLSRTGIQYLAEVARGTRPRGSGRARYAKTAATP